MGETEGLVHAVGCLPSTGETWNELSGPSISLDQHLLLWPVASESLEVRWMSTFLSLCLYHSPSPISAFQIFSFRSRKDKSDTLLRSGLSRLS